MSGKLPRSIIGEIPVTLFRGELIENTFVSMCKFSLNGERLLPPRFTILLAALTTRSAYEKQQVLYHEHDYPYNIFIVLNGTFAYVKQKIEAPSGAQAVTESGDESERPKLRTSFTGTALFAPSAVSTSTPSTSMPPLERGLSGSLKSQSSKNLAGCKPEEPKIRMFPY